jgi:phosphatidylserine/phosphatidylglycerophosphate/cardiolipin synthase-like enzyme
MRASLLLLPLLMLACGPSGPSVEAFFCPQDGCKDRVVEQIDTARESVVCAVYTFTHDDIVSALIRARERGVGVWVVVEEQQYKASGQAAGARLMANGIGFATDTNPEFMHDKFTVIDDDVVLTGSFNYTLQADQKNNENLVIIRSGGLAKEFFAEWQALWDAAEHLND